jgi:hypothetical protein
MFALRDLNARKSSGRFAYLMGLYAENYWRLTRVFGPQRLALGRYESRVGDGLDLHLDVLERHPYTLDLRLSYLFRDEHTGSPDPSAHVRLYADARVAEVTACYVGSRLEDVLGRGAEARAVFDHRLRMSAFLDKWLEYLSERGHSRFTLQPAAA